MHVSGKRYRRKQDTLQDLEDTETLVESQLLLLSVYNPGSRYKRVRGAGEVSRCSLPDDGASRLMGEINPIPTSPTWSDVANDMEIATDGTVKD